MITRLCLPTFTSMAHGMPSSRDTATVPAVTRLMTQDPLTDLMIIMCYGKSGL